MDDDELTQFRFDYYNGSFAKAGLKPRFLEKMKHNFGALFMGFLGLIAIGLIFVVINFIVVGAQELWHSADNKTLHKIEQQLNTKDEIIADYESRNAAGELTENEYNNYTSLVQEYNDQINEYNKLAEKIGATYYIVPGIRHK